MGGVRADPVLARGRAQKYFARIARISSKYSSTTAAVVYVPTQQYYYCTNSLL